MIKEEEKVQQSQAQDNEKAEKPWLHINDVLRMSLTVKSVYEAERIADHLITNFFHNGKTMIALKPKLNEPTLRNITIHGYNLDRSRIQHFTDNVSCVIGTEI